MTVEVFIYPASPSDNHQPWITCRQSSTLHYLQTITYLALPAGNCIPCITCRKSSTLHYLKSSTLHHMLTIIYRAFPAGKKKKKIWNRVHCQRTEKKIQNAQEIKRTLFIWTKQEKTCKFSRKSSFSSDIQHKNRKTNNSFNLSCVSWMWKAGGRMCESVLCPFPSTSLPHQTDTR